MGDANIVARGAQNNTVFDSVFKTMLHKMPQLVIPFINEAFGRDYPRDEKLVSFSNEHETFKGTIIDDSVFRLQNKIYHVECQSTNDTDMVIRMIEYDFAIALEAALKNGRPYEMDFPESCVLYLRHNKNTPDSLDIRVNLPGGNHFMYQAKVFKAQQITKDELFQKRLLLLLPYYLMRYEDEVSRCNNDDRLAVELVAECSEMRSSLERITVAEGNALLYEQLIELIITVSDHIFAAHDSLRKKVKKAMGGEVLELMHERAERLEREAEERGLQLGLEQGREQGLEQGLEQGREQGREQGIDALAEKLKEQGLDESLIRAAVDTLKRENQTRLSAE